MALRILYGLERAIGYDVAIFGGSHGELPLTEHAGALIGETVPGMRESCILDLSMLGTRAAERRFMLAFPTNLYKRAADEPLHMVFDQADMWAPQRRAAIARTEHLLDMPMGRGHGCCATASCRNGRTVPRSAG